MEIKQPRLDGTGTLTEQVEQMRSYLFQMVGEMNWALSTIEKDAQAKTPTDTASKADLESLEQRLRETILQGGGTQ